MRDIEKEVVQLENIPEEMIYMAVYDMRYFVVLNAWMGIATTFLVCIVLMTGAMLFGKMTTDLVISPIEQMIQKVNEITENPLKAAQDEEEKLLMEELACREEEDAHTH